MEDPKTGKADAGPPRQVFRTEEEMRERARALRAEGRVVIPMDNPLGGLTGFMSFRERPEGHVGDWDEEAALLEWPVYGRRLEPEERGISTAAELVAAYEAHRDHAGFRAYSDPTRCAAGFVCYCRAPDGTSIVFMAPAKDLPASLDGLSGPAPGRSGLVD